MDIEYVGRPETIRFEDGEIVEGWIYGELPEGLLISLDPEGHEVRLFAKNWTSRSGREAPEAKFSLPKAAGKQLRSVEEFIGPKMADAYGKLNFRTIQDAVSHGAALSAEISGREHNF